MTSPKELTQKNWPKELNPATCAITTRGYEAMGAFGLSGRRNFRKMTADGTHLVHAHAYSYAHPYAHPYAFGDPSIQHHTAFRDLLRNDPEICAPCQTIKIQADTAVNGNSDRYMKSKDRFIKTHEALALQMALKQETLRPLALIPFPYDP